MSEVRSILGPARRFKLRQLCPSSVTEMPFAGMSPLDAVVEKTRRAFSICRFPCSAEIAYIKVGDFTFLGEEFALESPQEFVSRFLEGAPVVTGCFVGFTRDGVSVSTYQSAVGGTLVYPDSRNAFGWDGIVRLDRFDSTALDMLDSGMRAAVSFRREAYLLMWFKNFPFE